MNVIFTPQNINLLRAQTAIIRRQVAWSYIEYKAHAIEPSLKGKALQIFNTLKQQNQSSSEEETNNYKQFQQWLQQNAPYIAGNYTNILTEQEFYKLKENYTGKEIADTIMQIENRKDLRKRYTNLYRTLLNWLKTNVRHT